MFRYEFVEVTGRSSRNISRFKDRESAHIRLARYAGENGLRLHIHEGIWTDSARSTAHEDIGDYYSDPVIGVKAYVRRI